LWVKVTGRILHLCVEDLREKTKPPEVKKMNKKQFTYGIFIGGAVGALSALLTTPFSGKYLRHQAKETTQEWIQMTKDISANLKELRSSISTLTEEGKVLIKDLLSDIKVNLKDWQESIDPNKQHLQKDIVEIQSNIEELEQKLQDKELKTED
jgi:gas vesicle protein